MKAHPDHREVSEALGVAYGTSLADIADSYTMVVGPFIALSPRPGR